MCIGGVSEEEKKKHATIEIEIEQDKRELRNKVKLLLLGAGESGKSTIAKQLKIIHLNGFTDDEKKSYIPIIYANIGNFTITATK
jgi:polynucleotide 5'-kinase involved in rRNA processing